MNLSREPQGAAGIEMAAFTDRGYRSRAAREKALRGTSAAALLRQWKKS
jgi:hypothetical protein